MRARKHFLASWFTLFISFWSLSLSTPNNEGKRKDIGFSPRAMFPRSGWKSKPLLSKSSYSRQLFKVNSNQKPGILNLPSSPSGENRPLSGAVSSFRAHRWQGPRGKVLPQIPRPLEGPTPGLPELEDARKRLMRTKGGWGRRRPRISKKCARQTIPYHLGSWLEYQ